MASASSVPFLSVEQYLAMALHPDMDYVDGVLEERNMGEFDHGDLQWALLEALNAYTPTLGIRARPEVRVQVGPTRFRVPDICVVSADWKRTQIIVDAPLLCIEILSPGDRTSDAVRRSNDYLVMGVLQVWIVDPRARTLAVVTEAGTLPHLTGPLTIPSTGATLDLVRIFSVLEQ